MPVRHPKVAVLLAAFNGMQWIKEQLASILEQTGVDVTVYISIDPSTDGTEAWCIEFAAIYPRAVVLPSAGSFGGASRNFFRLIRDVNFDKYDFVAFADQDDVWGRDKLQRACETLDAQNIDGYSSNVVAFWSSGKTHLIDKAQPQVAWDYLFEAAGPGCTYVLGHTLANELKAAVCADWDKVQEVSLHDWYCYAFARSNGFRWYTDPIPSMQYRQHESNQVGANIGINSLLMRYKSIHDGWWFSQVQLIAELVGKHEDPFVQPWFRFGRRQLMRLSFHAWKCRRRVRDKVFFFLICWATAIIGKKAR
ncbi:MULTISPECIES: glycosyltransferase [Pseudomonas]|uniref:glycosyltransferase n=1 Tax=Pseudomonas TaxID=286 RepID=UPI000D225948|nr:MULTISPECIES: glycosyltransferase [Pseudomonas]AVX90392.1 glycosyl transferase [Pseudomonas koreensis]MBI6948168.1 glycosyltransferase [Pseudomonas koreensis]MCU7215929.1 glycosyltransferase [Pseudomonas sp. VE 196-7]